MLRCLLEGLRWLWGAEAVKVVGKSGISQPRSRLGEMPPRQLCEQMVQPVATRPTKGHGIEGGGWRAWTGQPDPDQHLAIGFLQQGTLRVRPGSRRMSNDARVFHET